MYWEGRREESASFLRPMSESCGEAEPQVEGGQL